MPTTKRELRYMTYKEVEEIFATDPVILIPMGSMEEHGPHSIVGDYLAAEEAAKVIAEQADCYTLPVIPFGCSEYFRAYPGTISFSSKTLYGIIADMVTNLLEHGVKKILIVNGHAGNSAVLEMFARDLRREKGVMLGKFDIWQTLTPEMKQEFYGENAKTIMGHGGEPVTSVMHYLTPENMRMDLVGEYDRQFQWQDFAMTTIGRTNIDGTEAFIYYNMEDCTKRGCLGDPEFGNAQIGEKIFGRMVKVGCEFVRRMKNSEMRI